MADERPAPVFPVWPMQFPPNVLTQPSESESKR